MPQKLILGSDFRKSNSGLGISSSKIQCVPNYARYFGSNNIEGFGESWMEAEMRWSWVELGEGGGGGGVVDRTGGRWFSNTRLIKGGDNSFFTLNNSVASN